MLLTRSPLSPHNHKGHADPVRLACVKHAASVRPEPGSNSPNKKQKTIICSENNHPTTGQPIPTKKTQKTKTSINKTNTLSSSQTTPPHAHNPKQKATNAGQSPQTTPTTNNQHRPGDKKILYEQSGDLSNEWAGICITDPGPSSGLTYRLAFSPRSLTFSSRRSMFSIRQLASSIRHSTFST